MRTRAILPLILLAACARDGNEPAPRSPEPMGFENAVPVVPVARFAGAAADVTSCVDGIDEPPGKLTVTSSAFNSGAAIPPEHTCQGADVSPPLAWTGAPPDTKSFAIVADDPDAPTPQRLWIHWVVVDLASSQTSLERNAAARLPGGGVHGRNDWNKTTWNGPCPPEGVHRYVFKVYALDTTISGHPNKKELTQAMRGHVRACGALVGIYERAPS
jgi:Raf kinase inhibitor-like YbhB/YbcL family protein